MGKIARLVEAKELKLGDVVITPGTTVRGPLHRVIVLIRHSPGSIRYAFNLDDNDYFTLDEGNSVYILESDAEN
jgi:hypothetical protein